MKYNADTQTLRIFYVSGSVYDYKNVPEDIYEKMRTSGSKGIFLNREIKTHFNFEKVK